MLNFKLGRRSPSSRLELEAHSSHQRPWVNATRKLHALQTRCPSVGLNGQSLQGERVSLTLHANDGLQVSVA
jgi:hypothetical protein